MIVLGSADLVQPNSFLSCPFLAQALLMAGCASATSVRASNYNDVASSRSVNICKDGLGRLTEKWSGVEWIDSAMEALIVDSMESDMPSTTTSAGKIKSKDRGLINRAKLDDLTRSWLEKALGTSAMGVSVTGQLDEVSWMDGDFVFRDAFAPTASVNELFNYTGSN